MRKLAVGVLIGILVVFGLLLGARYAAQRNVRRANLSPLANLIKARMGAAISVPATQSEGIRHESDLLDTYASAFRLGLYAAQRGEPRPGSPPISSAALPLPSFGVAQDAWGRPFCVARTAARLAIYSSGPTAPPVVDCRSVLPTVGISRLKAGRLIQLRSGGLLLVLAPGTLARGTRRPPTDPPGTPPRSK
jgi:hypothetical protein